ncbi:hypothetical protein EON65_32390 [archaeon]|nr:MAG: hypothetical protein EON65_32390 [archaeon]
MQALQVEPSIQEVTLLMPNIHNMVFNLEQYGLKNQDKTGLPNILYPIDEPHGMIKVSYMEQVACYSLVK